MLPACCMIGGNIMDWIKVTPETMPPDMEPVMVTLMFSDADGKFVWADARYNGVKWEYL